MEIHSISPAIALWSTPLTVSDTMEEYGLPDSELATRGALRVGVLEAGGGNVDADDSLGDEALLVRLNPPRVGLRVDQEATLSRALDTDTSGALNARDRGVSVAADCGGLGNACLSADEGWR